MEKMTADKALGTAKLILLAQYLGALVVMPVMARVMYSMRGEGISQVGNYQLLGLALLAVGLVDYGISLFLEKQGLEKARASGSPGGIVTTAVIIGAFGASLAVYGLILSALHVARLAEVLFGLCLIHGIHLLLRWPNYAEAAREIETKQA